MSYGRDKTLARKQSDFRRKYVTGINDKVGASIKNEKKESESSHRQKTYNDYVQTINEWKNKGMPVNEIYKRLNPFMKNKFRDPKAVIEKITGEKIILDGPKVIKGDEHDNR